MTLRQAFAFVHKHGVVLESAAGPVPSLAAAIADTPIHGSWWSHPQSHEIFAVSRAIRHSEDILVCRLVNGKITFVHRRLWPALVCAANRFPRKHLYQVHEVHSASGHHMTKEIEFPQWVPAEIEIEAAGLSEEDAVGLLGTWCC